MENEAKIPYRKRERGERRLKVCAAVSIKLHGALETAAEEQGVSLSTFAADLLAEKMGIPA